MSKQKKIQQFYINGISLYAHDKNEALERYKKQHVLQQGAILRIDNKYFKEIGGKLYEISKKK